MSVLYRVDSSIQGAQSVTRQVADEFEWAWREAEPDGVVTRRDLLTTPLSPATWQNALTAMEAGVSTSETEPATALARQLADEMVAADIILIGAPLYNWGPTPHMVCWIDLLWTDPRFAPRTYPLAGKPVILDTARGGDGSAGGTRDGWDNSAPYLQRTFGPDVFGGELTLIQTPLTLADHNPRMVPLREKAAELRAQSLARANQLGRSFGLEAGAIRVP